MTKNMRGRESMRKRLLAVTEEDLQEIRKDNPVAADIIQERREFKTVEEIAEKHGLSWQRVQMYLKRHLPYVCPHCGGKFHG